MRATRVIIISLLIAGCNGSSYVDDKTPSPGINVSGAESVKHMFASCPTTGDFKGNTKVAGEYAITTKAPTYFKYPREKNFIIETLKLNEKTSLLADKLSLQTEGGKLTAGLSVYGDQKFQGSIYEEPQRLCFFGPFTMKVAGATAEAYLYGDGKYTKGDPTSLELTITVGITATREDDKSVSHIVVNQGATAKPVVVTNTSQSTGLFVAVHQGDELQKNLFVEEELSIEKTDAGLVLTAKARRQRFRFGTEAETLIFPLGVELPILAVNLKHANTQGPVKVWIGEPENQTTHLQNFRNCDMHQQADEASINGNFRCEQEDTVVEGQFFFKRPAVLP